MNSPVLPKATQLMKSALCSPSLLIFLSTASVNLAIAVALSPCEYLTSGSRVSLPIKIALFMLYLNFLFLVWLYEYENNVLLDCYILSFDHLYLSSTTTAIIHVVLLWCAIWYTKRITAFCLICVIICIK